MPKKQATKAETEATYEAHKSQWCKETAREFTSALIEGAAVFNRTITEELVSKFVNDGFKYAEEHYIGVLKMKGRVNLSLAKEVLWLVAAVNLISSHTGEGEWDWQFGSMYQDDLDEAAEKLIKLALRSLRQKIAIDRKLRREKQRKLHAS